MPTQALGRPGQPRSEVTRQLAQQAATVGNVVEHAGRADVANSDWVSSSQMTLSRFTKLQGVFNLLIRS